MIETLVTNTRRISRWMAVAIALAVAAPSVAALAGSPTDGKIATVEYYPGTLLIQMAGVNYLAQLTTQSGCTANNQSIDTLKIWHSMAQTALLAGKTTRIYFNVCSGVNYISVIDVNQ
jgi:hypothetical protein